MRDILTDVVRQTKDLFEQIKVTGTEEATKIQGVDKDKTLFLEATLNNPLPEFIGEFGISNLHMLDNWLNHSPFKSEKSSFSVVREVKNGSETVTSFEFRAADGYGSSHKTMAANLVAEQAKIANIPWQVTVVPSKAKIAEFQAVSRIFSEVDSKSFRISTTKSKELIFSLGDENAATHNVSMVFEANVTGELNGSNMMFDTNQFLGLMKIAGANPTTMNITSKGVLGMVMQTLSGTYNYYLRAKR